MLANNYNDFNLKLIIVMSIVFQFGQKKKNCFYFVCHELLNSFWVPCYFQKSRVWDASIVALVLWDLTLFLTAAQNTERQAINLWGKKKYRFRDTWKQPTGMDQMDFSSLCPIFFSWTAMGGGRKSWRGKSEKEFPIKLGSRSVPVKVRQPALIAFTCWVLSLTCEWVEWQSISYTGRNNLLRECYCWPNC